jgi:DNA end-binding protein Ku
MAARSTWKGSLKFSLITIPIRVFMATNPGSDVSFRQFHRKCHTRIQLKKWCPHCEEEVSADDIVKGYESSKGRFVMVEQEDVAKLRPESTHVIDITHVTDAAAIDPLHVERTYFLAPDNKTAGPPFAVLRDALDSRAGVGRLALHGREYLVAVVSHDDSLMLHTLRTAGEVRDAAEIENLRLAAVKTKPEEVKLARQILNSFESVPDLSKFTDHYQEALKAMLKAKRAVEVAGADGESKGVAPVDLMEALRRSLAQASGAKTRGKAAHSRKAAAKVLHYPASKRHRKAS